MSLTFDKTMVVVGRDGADLGSPHDKYLSPSHAQFVLRDGKLVSLRDTFHLSAGRNVIIGRDEGDGVFP